jgi:hypothetical protein
MAAPFIPIHPGRFADSLENIMMRQSVLGLCGLALVLAGCGKKPEDGGWVGAEKTNMKELRPATKIAKGIGATDDQLKKVVVPPPKLPALRDLQVTLPAGWAASWLDLSNEWAYDKREPKATYRVTVTRSVQEPPTLEAYLKQIKDKPDDGTFIWPAINESGNLPDGFYIVGRPRQITDVTNKDLVDVGFIVVRQIGGDRIRFRTYNVDDAARQEALEFSKAARFAQ